MNQSSLNSAAQRPHEHPLRAAWRVAIAALDAAKSTCQPQFQPIRGPVHTPVETAGVDEGLQEQQRMTEALLPIRSHATLQQAKHG